MSVFRTDEDRKEYLRLMREMGERYGLRFLSWCLMDNHIHLIVVPSESGGLARGIGEAHRRYTRHVNFREGVRGYLFQGRFYSCPLGKTHLAAAVRYVERNPVRAKLVRCAWRYAWSSAAFRVGDKRSDPLVEEREISGIDVDWRAALRVEPEEAAYVQEKLRTGRPCGDRRFVRRLEKLTGRTLTPRPPGRPKESTRQKKRK